MGDGLFAGSVRFHREVASQRQIRTTPGRLGVRSGSLNRENIMAVISMKQLLEAGVDIEASSCVFPEYP